MTYEVKTDSFEGPLDLLLQLVSKEQLDIADVSISSITRQYLDALRKMDHVDLEIASSFLILAATLLELKSIRLLPHGDLADPELRALLEERDHLLHRLIEYSTFKEAASALVGLLQGHAGFHYRSAEIPEELLSKFPDLLYGVTAIRLNEIATKALSPTPIRPVDTSFMTPIRVSVGEMADLLMDELRERGTSSFAELCRSAGSRIERIVRFLALLELFRSQSVELEQDRPFGEIVVRYREPASKGAL